MYKTINELCWLEVDGKLVLVIGEHWGGQPLIATQVDLLIIRKDIFKKYKASFIKGCDLSKTKICYTDGKPDGRSKNINTKNA